MTDNLKQLRLTDFKAHMGDDFIITLHDEDGSTEDYTLTLIEAEAVGIKERDEAAFGRESFALRFRNPDTSRYLQQQIYPLHHAAFENLALFLVPVGPDNKGMVYEVIFT